MQEVPAAESADVELLAAVASGDEDALRELVQRHSAWLLLRLRRRTPDADLAVDALQDTFVAVWRSARSYRGDGDVGGWLWGILHWRAPRADPLPAMATARRANVEVRSRRHSPFGLRTARN
jgi:hypothetical protein